MPRFPKLFVFVAFLLWLPFPFLFVPFTFMREDYHPWYITYSSLAFLLAHFFYYPAIGASQLFTHGGQHSFHVAAFAQSALFTALLWLLFRSRSRQLRSIPSTDSSR
jgi:hypothetical protein